MTHSFTQKLGVCAIAAAVTVAATTPGFAAERPAPAPTPPTLLSSAQKHVQQLARVSRPAIARSVQEPTGGFDEPGTFFRTRRGVALLVLAGAGIGYMWYSKFHDRVDSPARQQLDQ